MQREGALPEWSVHRTCNPAVLHLNPTLATTWILSSNARLRLQIANWFAFRELGFPNCYVQFELFVSVVCSVPLAFVLLTQPRINKAVYLFFNYFIVFVSLE